MSECPDSFFDPDADSEMQRPDRAESPSPQEPAPMPIIRRTAPTNISAMEPAAEGMLGPGADVVPAVQAAPFPWRAVLHHKWTFLGVLLLVAVPSMVICWTMVVPNYETNAKIRVRPLIPRLVFQTDENGKIPLYEGYMKTQMSIVQSSASLSNVLELPEVQATQWYNQTDPFWRLSPKSRLERLQADLFVTRQRGTELIDVMMKTTMPQDGALIVNALLDEYIGKIGRLMDEDDDKLMKQLVMEYESITKEIDQRENNLAGLRKELGTNDAHVLVSRKRLRLDELEAEMESRKRILTTAEWRKEQLEKRLKAPARNANSSANQAEVEEVHPNYQDDAEWRRLHGNMQIAKHLFEVEGGQFGQSHPKRIAMAKGVKFAEKLLHQHESLLDSQRRFNTSGVSQGPVTSPLSEANKWQVRLFAYAPRSLAQELRASYAPRSTGQELGATNWQIELLKYEENVMEKDLTKLRETWDDTFKKAEIFAKEQRGVDQKKQLLEAVRIRLEQKTIERKVPDSAEILSRAIVPTARARDRRLFLSALALFVSVASGFGAAFMKAKADPPLDRASELASSCGISFLGLLPRAASSRNGTVLNDPFLNEGIRMIRTPLLRRIEEIPGSVVLITSPGPGEGKTTVAVMLAQSLARCGKRVLLVDADLRNPSVSAQLGIYARTGFIDALSRGEDGNDWIVTTGIPRLSVLPGGATDHSVDPEFISNGLFSSAINKWRKDYDVVLLDSPPVLPVADARILARQADGTILVAWAQRTRRADAIDAVSYLTSAGANLWGTVLVGTRPHRYYKRAHMYEYAPKE